MDRDCGPIRQVDCRAPLGESRPNAREDVDQKDSPTNTARRIPGPRIRRAGRQLLVGISTSMLHNSSL